MKATFSVFFGCFSPLYGQILGRNPGNMSSHKKRSLSFSFRDFLSFSNFLAFWGCSALHSATNSQPNNIRGFEPHTAHGGQGPISGRYETHVFLLLPFQRLSVKRSVPHSRYQSYPLPPRTAAPKAHYLVRIWFPGFWFRGCNH